MLDPTDAQIAVSAMSLVSGAGLISVGFFVADRAWRLELTMRAAVSAVIAASGAYGVAQGVTLQAGLSETMVLTAGSFVAVVLFATRYGRNQGGIGGRGGWGMTAASELAAPQNNPRSQHSVEQANAEKDAV
jgi:hypothetical protein